MMCGLGWYGDDDPATLLTEAVQVIKKNATTSGEKCMEGAWVLGQADLGWHRCKLPGSAVGASRLHACA